MDINSKIRLRPDKYSSGNNGKIIPVMRSANLSLKAGSGRLQYPCSMEQRRIWLLHQVNPHHPALNLVVRWHPQWVVSIIELETALRAIMARHPVLRTLFMDVSGEIIQLVEPHVAINVTTVDLTGIKLSQKLIETRNNALVEKNAAFDLSMTPLLRVKYLRLEPDSSEILVTLHHIVCDVNSVEILLHEINNVCAALREGRPHALPELPVDYGDFTAKQVERLAQPVPQTESEYWMRELQNFKYFEIQPDHTRPRILSANTDTLSLPLDSKLIDELALIGLQHGATLSMTITTVLLVLLYRYTGETDITIGRQLSNRDNEGLKNLVGLIGAVLVIRNDLSGDPGFITLLARTRNKCTEMEKYSRITMNNLVELVNPVPDPGRNPLFAVNFILHQSLVPGVSGRFDLFEPATCSPAVNCDLDFAMVKGLEGWRISCQYNTDLFERRSIINMLKHFTTLLHSVAENPVCAISELDLLDESERLELIVERNRNCSVYPKHQTVSQLFEDQARRTPDAIAVMAGERSLSYRELDLASNRLAHVLIKQGVEPASRVAVILDRSPELIVALLAVLKSGSAYVPLDPVYPQQRLQHVFENSRPAAVLTRTLHRESLLRHNVPVILVDMDCLSNPDISADPLDVAVSSEDAAYIIYTSGSTGKPKGVSICHRSLVNLLFSMRRKPGLTADDTVVSVTTISFDMVVPDLFLPLIVGARLILAREQEMSDGAALHALLRRHSATFMQATPVTWQLLLEAGWHGDPSLKMLCGGEALPRRLAERLLESGGELWNMYGPTETTVWSSVLRVESGAGPVTIGPPIDNTQFYILDSHQQLVPDGAPGELCIGGDGVALGYFDLPEVTKEKFIPDMFSNHAASRLYRTGDIMRRRQNGQMEFLGRSDHQVKLRGFRIELGEIEAVLLRHVDVTEAIAILGKDQSGESAIWAYVVQKNPSTSRSTEVFLDTLRKSLESALPGYMCPAAIVILDDLPRTPNLKIDRHALPVPTLTVRPIQESTQPQNVIERRLAQIWTSVLGHTSIGKTEDFFDLGGHSLLAAKLLSRIEAEFGQRLGLLDLFNAPNIEAQAKLLMHNNQREYDFRQVVRLQPEGGKHPLIAIHNTGVYYYNLSRHLGVDQPLMALQLFDPSITRENFPGSLEEIAAEYVQLIYKFQPTGPYLLIGWCVGGILAFEIARQLVETGHEVRLLAMIDTWAPGHNARLSRWRAILADYSYRWQLIHADWGRVKSGQQSVADFIAQRVIVKKLLRVFDRTGRTAPAVSSFEDRTLNAEQYDQWLLTYLEEMAKNYRPVIYPGKITLLCSAQEPKGLFLDPVMGWGGFAAGGIKLAVIDGDHFTMFKGRGLKQMAEHVGRAMSEQ